MRARKKLRGVTVRFAALHRAGHQSECWIWAGATDRLGYGLFWFRGRAQRAHRISHLIHKGEIPPGQVVRHECDVRGCVNPAHLLLGTQSDNAKDCWNRARSGGAVVDPTKRARGEQRAKSNLRNEDILLIRGDARPRSEVAADYGVSTNTIRAIQIRKSWAHI